MSMVGVVWPALRLLVLAFNLLFILNLLVLGDKKEEQQQHQPTQEFTHHETSLLSDCPDDAFVVQKTPPPETKKEGICSKLSEGATAASLWTQNADTILKASIHPLDTDGIHAEWTESLLRLLSPNLLEKGLRTAPQHSGLHKISRILQEKIKNPDTAPPLEVLVVGGSVTEGGGCQNIPPSIKLDSSSKSKPNIQGQQCAWPYRLQQLLDAVLGEGIIRIHNLAVGGTNSMLAVPVLDYWLFPEGSPLLVNGPDVILNGYAANDNLPPVGKRGDDTNMTGDFDFFYRHGLHQAQTFIRTSLFSRPCLEDPLVFFVDEYLGNQHNLLLGELFRFEAVDILTAWYSQSAGAISPAQVVRRLIYAQTEELIFTAPWKKPTGEKRIDVHFGMPGHVHIAWTVAYSMLTMALDFCEEETSRQDSTDISAKFVPADTLQLVEQAVPPLLDAKLEVNDVNTQWKADKIARDQSEAEYCGDDVSTTKPALPCSFAFVAAPMGTVRNAGALNSYVNRFVVSNDGWSGKNDIRSGGWQNKLGYIATKEGASVQLRIDKTPNKVKTIILHTLKSYGEKWEGAKARFSVHWSHESGSHYNTTFDIEGFHNQNTSIAYPFTLDLGPDHTADKGSTFEMKIDLISGTNFKINAMMICSR